MGYRAFDEQQLLSRLTALPSQLRVAFAAACAQRLLPAYERYRVRSNSAGANEVATMLERIWRDLAGDPVSPEELQGFVDRAMAIIPREDADEWLPGQAAAEDAAAALAYVVRCRQNGEAQEAVWAARRVYEALDHFVIERDDVDTNLPGAEDRVLTDPLIQAELDRQHRDIDELLLAAADERVSARIRARAETDAKSLLDGPRPQ
jgi:uncharacterized protein YjaG (DUF416 family)